MQKVVTTKSKEETMFLAKSLLQEMSGGEIICLYGDLGSGKTTFAQGIGETLGITKSLTSPTFLIIKTYTIDNKRKFPNINKLYHVDLYRIQTEHDIAETGLREMLADPFGIVVIEWAERMGNLLPEKRIDVKFEYVGEDKRKISIAQV